MSSQGLAQEALENGQLLWKVRPKLHKCFGFCVPWGFIDLRLDHLVLDQSPFLGPLANSTYMDEDYVGKVKKLAMASTPQQMGRQVLGRWSAYACVRWLRRDE